jgi:hypothetical protein
MTMSSHFQEAPPFTHPNVDVGAETDSIKEAMTNAGWSLDFSETNKENSFEYVNKEGDPPFGKYRVTVEAIGVVESNGA